MREARVRLQRAVLHQFDGSGTRGVVGDDLVGALRDDIDARLASRIITYYYGIDGLLRTRDVFGWSLKRSNEWLLAHASAAVLRSPPEPLSPN